MSMARASVETSWSEAKQLWTKNIQPSNLRSWVKSPMRIRPSMVTAIISSAPMIQGRLRPIERIVTVSIKGAQISLKVQGSRRIAASSPASDSPRPREVRNEIKAMDMNPQGTPWAKYRAHRVATRCPNRSANAMAGDCSGPGSELLALASKRSSLADRRCWTAAVSGISLGSGIR